MESWFSFIAGPLGQFLYFIYNTLAFKYYGLAIIIFTIIIKFVLLPLTIKQYKSTARMQEINPMIQELQRKYKNDKEKLNQEMMKLYQEHKVNPAGGCLPLLIQMPILFSLLWVIAKPLTYMMQVPAAEVKKLFDQIPADSIYKIKGYYEQIGVVSYHGKLNMDFLGMNLGFVPQWSPSVLFGDKMYIYLPLLLLPLLAGFTTYISIKLSTPKPVSSNGADSSNMQASMTKSMTYMMPFVTLFFAFSVPAGLSLYWIVSNLFQMVQQLYINKYIKKKE